MQIIMSSGLVLACLRACVLVCCCAGVRVCGCTCLLFVENEVVYLLLVIIHRMSLN